MSITSATRPPHRLGGRARIGEATAVVGGELVLRRQTGPAGAELVAALEVDGHVLADRPQDDLVPTRHLDGEGRLLGQGIPVGRWRRDLVRDAHGLDHLGGRPRVADLEPADLPLPVDLVIAVRDEVVRTSAGFQIGADDREHVDPGQCGAVGHRRVECGQAGQQLALADRRVGVERGGEVDRQPGLHERDVLRLRQPIGRLRLGAQDGRERHRDRHDQDAADHHRDEQLGQGEPCVGSGRCRPISRLRHL